MRIDPAGGGVHLNLWPLAPSGTSLCWTSLSKGKRSVTLNFWDPDGRRLLGDLLAVAQAVILADGFSCRTQLDQLAANQGI
jgi:crotonobetainyl-CoA:carnitine CoA-transferase CaiB-like acyl-CoA transferase